MAYVAAYPADEISLSLLAQRRRTSLFEFQLSGAVLILVWDWLLIGCSIFLSIYFTQPVIFVLAAILIVARILALALVLRIARRTDFGVA